MGGGGLERNPSENCGMPIHSNLGWISWFLPPGPVTLKTTFRDFSLKLRINTLFNIHVCFCFPGFISHFSKAICLLLWGISHINNSSRSVVTFTEMGQSKQYMTAIICEESTLATAIFVSSCTTASKSDLNCSKLRPYRKGNKM